MSKLNLPPPIPPSEHPKMPAMPWEGERAVDVSYGQSGRKPKLQRPGKLWVYPDGYQSQVVVGVAAEGKPQIWVQMDPEQARELARSLTAAAAVFEGKGDWRPLA
jgi:hypothetical protein